MPFPIDTQFNVDLADALARIESYNKHLYRPNTYLHKWWARRCGSTFRLILKHLVSNPQQVDYYTAGGLEGQIILDPMMGGGTTLHEATRLGANVIGVDVDPIPVLQAQATLSDTNLETLQSDFAQMFRAIREDIEGLFGAQCPTCELPTQGQFTLYALEKRCKCSSVLAVDSLVLRHNSDGSTIRICPSCRTIVEGGSCICGGAASASVIEKQQKVCPKCTHEFVEDLSRPFYQRYTPIATVGRCADHGLFFKNVSQAEHQLIHRANQLRQEAIEAAPADFQVHGGPKSTDLLRKGITSYLDLFSSRQVLYALSAIRALQPLEGDSKVVLGLLISTSMEFNSMLCGYKGGDKRRPGAIRHTFSHHAYSFPHTALENNPVLSEEASGTLLGLFGDRIRRARRWAVAPKERIVLDDEISQVEIAGEVDIGTRVDNPDLLSEGNRRFCAVQGSSTDLHMLGLEPHSVDHVVTDPPYYDSVQYSDLAAFFRVWLKQLLPESANWDYDVSTSAVESDGNGRYRTLLSRIFSECHRVLKPEGRMVFTFHHWRPKAWAALTAALNEANFTLVNHYIVHAENPISVHISNLKSLTHDAVLVFAKRGTVQEREWTRPSSVDQEDSFAFCRDCAGALGWLLSAQRSDQDIETYWSSLLDRSGK